MSKQDGKKRERGANYTPEEKTLLAELITQYKHIIEDKRTGGIHIGKKKEAWAIVTNKYNSSCTTGCRQTDQLKALYDNMKQKARKNIGESNKLEYIQNRKAFTQIGNNNESITEEDVARALNNIKEDKIQMNKTGGGVYKPRATDSDSKILAIIQDQVEPLPNLYDSAAVFFKDDFNYIQEVNMVPESVAVQPIHIQEVDMVPESVAVQPIPQDEIQFIVGDNVITTGEQSSNVADKENNVRDVNITPRKMKSTKLMQQKMKLKRNMSAEALKRLYFKKKCENAYLERKNIMLDILHKKQQHRLKMIILKKEIENLPK